MSSGEPDFKQLGNEEFRKGAYLKAAALYTKGLKLDPGNAVLLRSVPDELACECICEPCLAVQQVRYGFLKLFSEQ